MLGTDKERGRPRPRRVEGRHTGPGRPRSLCCAIQNRVGSAGKEGQATSSILFNARGREDPMQSMRDLRAQGKDPFDRLGIDIVMFLERPKAVVAAQEELIALDG